MESRQLRDRDFSPRSLCEAPCQVLGDTPIPRHFQGSLFNLLSHACGDSVPAVCVMASVSQG